MKAPKTRREFLHRLGIALAAGAGLPVEALFAGVSATGTGSDANKNRTAAGKQGALANNFNAGAVERDGGEVLHDSRHRFKISQWTGDDFTIGHNFRNGDFPQGFPTAPDRTVEFAILGGGIAGLTTAYYLRDHDFLLLEQYDELGGHARGGSFTEIAYSWGPVAVGSIEGIYGDLYSALSIEPKKMKAADNAFFWHDRWLKSGHKRNELKELDTNLRALFAQAQSSLKELGGEPTPESTQSLDLVKLDSMPFSSLLSDSSFSDKFTILLENVLKTVTNGTQHQISALAGLYTAAGLQKDYFMFEGGNSAITKALVARLKKSGPESRMARGAFVWKVEFNDAGAQVLYSTADGALHNTACKHVIFATPPMVAWRQAPGMSDRMKANLMPFKYGSYFVANCLLDKPIFEAAATNWLDVSGGICDIVIAERAYKGTKTVSSGKGSVLTLLYPFEPGSAGRPLLLRGDREKFADTTCDQMSQVVDGLEKHLQELVLSRWGHAMAVPAPNHFARLRKIMASYNGPYTLAHNSTQGLPSTQSAIRAAKFASDRAKAAYGKTSWLVGGKW